MRETAVRLFGCSRAATITEYALVAAVVLTASGAVGSQRFQAVKDEPCASERGECPAAERSHAVLTPAKPNRETVARTAAVPTKQAAAASRAKRRRHNAA